MDGRTATRRGVALALALLMVAGCGTSPEGPAVASAAGSAGPTATQKRDYVAEKRRWAQCMREHGVDMPDPGPDGKIIGFDWNQGGKGTAAGEVYARAEEACRQYETFNDIEREPLAPEVLALWRDWAACMRDHGWDQPDPDAYGFEPEEGRGDPALAPIRDAAEEACFDLMLAARQAGARS